MPDTSQAPSQQLSPEQERLLKEMFSTQGTGAMTLRERAHELLAQIDRHVSCQGDVRPGISHDWVCEDTMGALEQYGEVVKAELLNTPETRDFTVAVNLEAQHQRARWPSELDAGKTDADWFWLIGYLAGKALHNPGGETDKQLHRIITVAAAAANWHAAKLGQTNMRPGIETPTGETR